MKTQARRLRTLRLLAAANAVALALVFALDWRAGGWIMVLGAAALAAAYWRAQTAAARDAQRWQDVLDAMAAGVVLYDANDRLVLANADFRALYEQPGAPIEHGVSFEALLRQRVRAGLVPEAAGREDEWIAARLAQHRARAPSSFVREMANGRWRRITEQVLADGSRLGFSVDVTELVEQQRALAATRSDAEQARALLADALDAMPAAVELYDADDRLLLCNPRTLEMYPHMAGRPMLGQSFEALLRRAVADGAVPEARGREDAFIAERLASRGTQDTPRLQRSPSGAWVHIYERRMARGGLVAVRLDASDIVRQRQALAAAVADADADHATLVDAIEALPDGFALFDASDRLVLCNQRYREIYPDSAPAMREGESFESIVRYGIERGQYPQAGADPEAWLAERLRRHREPDGVAILQELPGNRWLSIDERRTRAGGVAGVRTDVTELIRTRQQLELLSTTDALTGLANRRRFDTRLAEEIQRAQRHGTPLALLTVDIDHFKRYNDHYGHPEGDRALRAVAAVLGQQARRPGELVARVGGEEFALLLPHAGRDTALAVAQRCGEAMRTLAWPHAASPDAAGQLTLSIGVALLRHASPRDDVGALLHRADAALYCAKAAGRARFELADDGAE